MLIIKMSINKKKLLDILAIKIARISADGDSKTLEMKSPLPGMRPSFSIRTFKMYLKDGPYTKRL